MRQRIRQFSGQRGQGLIEFVITVAVLGPLLLGIFQAVLLYRAKTVLDYAALQAARSGSTNFAQMSAMQSGLARGLMPLYAHDASTAGVAEAYGKAVIDTNTPTIAQIQIVSPTGAAFDSWKEKQFDGVEAIPNDSLPYRGNTVKSGVTVQDANVLKIEIHYKFPLIVPLIDRIIGNIDLARTAEEGHTVYSLNLVSQAIVRMQTPIRDRSLLP
jgi:hypothetical protein